MCTICGCNTHEETIGSHAGDAHGVRSAGAAAAPVDAGGQLHFGAGAAGLSVPGMSATRIIRLEADVLGANQRFADANRHHFAAHGVAAYNFVSSPGSGKTTLLCATIEGLRAGAAPPCVAVIEGDQQTSLDAERIRASGVQAVQVNTGRGCHLDARMIGEAFEQLDLHGHGHGHAHGHEHGDGSGHAGKAGTLAHDTVHNPSVRKLLLIENVGNLVCPALWDLGETAKVAILSVTEGDDKPVKYPDMFAAASLMVINKIDLLPYVDFDVDRCVEHAHRVNPDIGVLQVSATRGDGMPAWLDWLQVPRR